MNDNRIFFLQKSNFKVQTDEQESKTYYLLVQVIPVLLHVFLIIVEFWPYNENRSVFPFLWSFSDVLHCNILVGSCQITVLCLGWLDFKDRYWYRDFSKVKMF